MVCALTAAMVIVASTPTTVDSALLVVLVTGSLFQVVSIVCMPVWHHIACRFGKKTTWACGMIVSSGYIAVCFITVILVTNDEGSASHWSMRVLFTDFYLHCLFQVISALVICKDV